MIKIYAIAGLIFLSYVGFSQWRINSLTEQRDKANQKTSELTSNLKQERESRVLENFARSQYISELERSENEKKRLEDCIANKSCVATIRVRVPVYLPAEGGSSGAEEITAQLAPSAIRTRADLESRIRQWEAWGAWCQKTLLDWESKTNPN